MHLALGVEYNGAAFNGFQLQKTAPSVQGALEAGLSQVAARPIRITAAGRTDTGVHATKQVVGFRAPVERPLQAWLRGTNSLTPAAIKVTWVCEVDAGFNARYSATARRYMYVFYEQSVPSPLLEEQAVRTDLLDDEAMHRAAQRLLGERDFTTFRGAGCQSRSAHRCMHRLTVHRAGSLVVLDVSANAFLLHMMRNIAGALWQVGLGQRDPDWITAILAARDRRLAGRTAPAKGLYLVDVSYPGYDFPPAVLPGVLRALGGLDRFS